MITIADPLTPKPCKSRVFEKKAPPPLKKKKWRLGPQTWRFPKYESNKTKNADYFCHGILDPISGLCCTLVTTSLLAVVRRFLCRVWM